LSSVVVLVIQDIRMPIPEFKRQSPVSIDPNRPTTLLLALERMKPIASNALRRAFVM